MQPHPGPLQWRGRRCWVVIKVEENSLRYRDIWLNDDILKNEIKSD